MILIVIQVILIVVQDSINRQTSQVSSAFWIDELIQFIYLHVDATVNFFFFTQTIFFSCSARRWDRIVQTDCYPGQDNADVRQRESAEVQVRDTAKHWAGQHDKDRRIAENADG